MATWINQREVLQEAKVIHGQGRGPSETHMQGPPPLRLLDGNNRGESRICIGWVQQDMPALFHMWLLQIVSFHANVNVIRSS